MDSPKKSLWELLWDYDPNGLIVVDSRGHVQIVNPAFCRMFQIRRDAILGASAQSLLGDLDDFDYVWDTGEATMVEKAYPQHHLHVRQVIFKVEEEGVLACIMVDLSSDYHKRQESMRLKQQTLEKVHQVVNNQMKVAQEIAGLLGEATAETKASLLKLIRAIEEEM